LPDFYLQPGWPLKFTARVFYCMVKKQPGKKCLNGFAGLNKHWYKFLGPNCIAAIKLSLRRTLLLLPILFTNKQRGRLNRWPSLLKKSLKHKR
jgi:hypothetical protein